MRRLAHWTSTLFHPVFMPVYGLALLFLVDPRMTWFLRRELHFITLGMVAVLTVAFPLTSTLLLMRAGVVGDLRMPRPQERIAPFAITLFYYGVTWYMLRRLPLHPAVCRFMIGAGVALFITLLITPRWKISAHMVGTGGVLGAMLALGWLNIPPFFPFVALAILACGLVGTARLLASDHTPAQVHAGTALGVLCIYIAIGWS